MFEGIVFDSGNMIFKIFIFAIIIILPPSFFAFVANKLFSGIILDGFKKLVFPFIIVASVGLSLYVTFFILN